MFGLGALIGGVIGLGGSIFGGISASNAAKKQLKSIQRQQADNQAWYDRRYNEDSTKRADAQTILNKLNEGIRLRNQGAAGAAAVMGATEEGVAATKEANASAMADAVGQIAMNNERRKDQIEAQFQARKEALEDSMNNIQAQKANNIAQAVGGVASAAGELAGGALGDIKLW